MLVRALALLAWPTVWVAGHPHCWTGERSVDLDDVLDYCSTNDDAAYGVCCTDAEEEALSLTVEAVVASLTDECAAYYKEVECALCGSYSGHLHERLDGLLTMGIDFCESYTTACAGQIVFETDFCDTRTGGEDEDFYWSYPYTDDYVFGDGFTEVFNLSTDEKPGYTLVVHQTPDGGSYWLAGKEGMLKEVDVNILDASTTVMDLSGYVSGAVFYDGSTEEGFLDFAFSPMFATNNYFYASYNVNDTVVRNRLSKFVYTAGDSTATKASEEVILQSDERPEFLHNGGWVGFKPSVYGTDVRGGWRAVSFGTSLLASHSQALMFASATYHDLYWSVGDGGPQQDPNDHAQSTDTLFGSMVRISVPSDGTGYVVPSGNYGGILPEICAIGFRGHWRCSFDTANDDLYCGDVGYTKVESIDIVECGNNYGWRRFEGNRCTEYSETQYGSCLDADRTFAVPPIFEYCHYNYDSSDEGQEVYTSGIDICGDLTVRGSSVIGGHVYRGEAFADLLYGAYVFAEYQLRNIFYIKQGDDGTWTAGSIISDSSIRVLTFTETIKGELLVVDSLNNVYYLPCGDLCVESTTPSPVVSPAPTAPPSAITSTSTGTATSYTYLGCFSDSSTRVLTGSVTYGDYFMTTEVCAALCEGSTYFGTQYSSQCFCGLSTDDPDSLGTASCTTSCAGDSTQICGGAWALSVYEFTSS